MIDRAAIQTILLWACSSLWRAEMYLLGGGAVYFLSSGPMMRLACEFGGNWMPGVLQAAYYPILFLSHQGVLEDVINGYLGFWLSGVKID